MTSRLKINNIESNDGGSPMFTAYPAGGSVNLDIVTGSYDLPENAPEGTRQLVRKINSVQGIINVNAPVGETITRAGLSSVQLNSDGDYWLLEKVSLTRWELVDGYETGENAYGTYIKNYDSTLTGFRVFQANMTNTANVVYVYPFSDGYVGARPSVKVSASSYTTDSGRFQTTTSTGAGGGNWFFRVVEEGLTNTSLTAILHANTRWY